MPAADRTAERELADRSDGQKRVGQRQSDGFASVDLRLRSAEEEVETLGTLDQRVRHIDRIVDATAAHRERPIEVREGSTGCLDTIESGLVAYEP